ncbi:S8 family peptidase [Lysinibacillus sp. NPDC059133]|uniref:S8 family peptidase n=1 Tax=Lysinibacillus sp. NPDC059133 TaxID=3346737 RepID=UPI0036A0E4CD
MNDEKFSLINFKHRKQDDLRTEGGGDDKTYPWTLEGEKLKEHSNMLIHHLKDITQQDKPNVEHFPYILEVDIIDEAKAKSHQSKLISMFNVDSAQSQLGMVSENKLLLKLDQIESIKKTVENLTKLDKNKNSISAITEIKGFKPSILMDEEEEFYKINFIDFHNDTLNKNVLEYVEKKLAEKNIDFERQLYSKNNTVLEVAEVTLDKLTFIKELPIKAMEPMPKTDNPFLDLDINDESSDNFIKYDENKNYPVVGLLDSGVAILPQLKGFVRRGEGCNYNNSDLNTNHGTFIANLLIHGNQINSVNDYSIDGCIVVDVPVVKDGGVNESELIKNIRRAIESNPEVKIWNLSVSINGRSGENKFSDFAIALDEIQDEFNVLICKSAGNDSKSYILGEEPKKLSLGADSIRALTVGSISRKSDNYGFSKANYPSPYSRVGRGPAEIIKPELVHYGGDIFSKAPSPLSIADYDEIGEKSIISDGTLHSMCGTSYSTPKVAKLLAELYLALEMNEKTFDSLLLKSLVIHSASYLEDPALEGLERLRRVGYGKPENSQYIMAKDTPHSVTLVLNGNLKKKQRIDIMDFPYPKDLIVDGRFTGKIKVTLVYNNYLSKEMGPEYCQSNMVLRMGTYDKLVDRDTSIPTILNPIGRNGSQNLLLKTAYGVKKIKENIGFLKERNLIEFGDKYYPVKKFSADLEEAKDSTHKNYLSKDKKWFLYLEGQYRDFIFQQVNQDDSKLSMDYVLVITISDPKASHDVYSDTIRELENHNFEYSKVNIENYIDIYPESN